MDVEKLEKLAELKNKGALTQEEFETEKKKILNAEITKSETSKEKVASDTIKNTNLNIGNKLYDWWHNNGMVAIMIVLIAGTVLFINSNERNLESSDWIIIFIFVAVIGTGIKEYQKMSKNINDLHRYADIDEVITRYGTPDDIKKFENYTKYIFKKSTKGWGHFKYQVDIFTTQNDKIIKHENFYE